MLQNNSPHKNYAVNCCHKQFEQTAFQEYIHREIIENEESSDSQKITELNEIKVIFQAFVAYKFQNNSYKNLDYRTQQIFDSLAFLEKQILSIGIKIALNLEIFGSKNKVAKSAFTANELALLFHYLRDEKIVDFNNKRMGYIISQLTDYSERFGDIFTNQNYLDDAEAKKNLKKSLNKIIKKIS